MVVLLRSIPPVSVSVAVVAMSRTPRLWAVFAEWATCVVCSVV